MEKKVEEVMGEINYIKSTMDSSKIQYTGIYRLSIIYGAKNIIQIVIALIAIMASNVNYISAILLMILDISFVISYFYIYKSEKKYMNKYYLAVLNIWGLFAVGLPIISRILFFIGSFSAGETRERIEELEAFSFSDVIFFSIFLIVCSYIFQNRKLIYAAMFSILIYYILYVFFFDVGIRIGGFWGGTLILPSIYFICINFVYIIAGLAIRKKEKCHEKL